VASPRRGWLRARQNSQYAQGQLRWPATCISISSRSRDRPISSRWQAAAAHQPQRARFLVAPRPQPKLDQAVARRFPEAPARCERPAACLLWRARCPRIKRSCRPQPAAPAGNERQGVGLPAPSQKRDPVDRLGQSWAQPAPAGPAEAGHRFAQATRAGGRGHRSAAALLPL